MAEEFDQAEYDRLSGEQGSLESQQEDCQSEIDDIQGKIDRLEAAYDIIDSAKENVKDIKKEIKKIPDDELSDWAGAKFNEVKESSEEGYFKWFYQNYIDAVDGIEDSINDEITRLKNIQNDKYGLLGDLVDAWNNVTNAIHNLFN